MSTQPALQPEQGHFVLLYRPHPINGVLGRCLIQLSRLTG